jgi:predicted lactoylglutathione lyase
MFDHVSIGVKDFVQSKEFYSKVLASIGIKIFMDKGDSCGFGKEHPFFWIGVSGESFPVSEHVHIAFSADNKEQVEQFYKTALELGAKDNGAPGYRTRYHPGYYAAFVRDLDGNNVEAVFRDASKQ